NEAAAAKVAPLLPPEKYFVFLPGSAWPGKKWPYFAELAERAARLGPVVVLGGEGDLECDAIAERARRINSNSVSLRGKTSMPESAAVIARAALVVGNDTGMVHVAEALGRPALVVEGPTSEALGFSVFRPESQVAALDLLCRPCSKSGRFCWRLGARTCMRGLSVDRVFSALQ